MFNGLEAHITHPRPSRVKNETEQRLEQKEQKGMKTSLGKALGHPKPHCPPPTPTSPAPKNRGADSSEAPPGWGGREREATRAERRLLGGGGGRWAKGDPRLGAPWRPGWVPAAR